MSITVSNGIVEVPDGSVVVEGYDVKVRVGVVRKL